MQPESVIAFNIVSGNRPLRPNNPTADHWLPDPVWDTIGRCWDQALQSRLPVDSLYRAFIVSLIDTMDEESVIVFASPAKAEKNYRHSETTPGRARND